MESFVASLDKALSLASRRSGEQGTVWRKLSTVVQQCGWKRRTAARMTELEHALAEIGIFASVDLADLDLGPDTTVRFARRPWTPVGRIIKPERALAYLLSENPATILEALPQLGRITHLHGGRTKERKYSLHGSQIRPDLVFRSDTGAYVVFELKSEQAEPDAVTQLKEYIEAVAGAHAAPVRGVLVAARPSNPGLLARVQQELKALRVFYPVDWIWYDVAVKASRVEPV